MFRPLLAPNVDPMGYPQFFDDLVFPYLISPKLDGIRSANRTGKMLTRSLKLVKNKEVQQAFSAYTLGLDGELIVGDATDGDIVYNRTQSVITTIKGSAEDVNFHVFDYCGGFLDAPFEERFEIANFKVSQLAVNFPLLKVHIVPHTLVRNLEELLTAENHYLEMGYEGIMGRNPKGRYKTNARCTWKENIIFKLKRFVDEEGEIVDFVERMKNTNEEQTNELGRTFRSDTKDAKEPLGMIGKFIVKTDNYGLIEVGPGSFKHEQLKEMFENWNTNETVRGSLIKFRHFLYGIKDKPRFPRAVGLRTLDDMS